MPAEKERQNIGIILLALALGVMVGKNWPKIKKSMKPFLKSLEKQYSNVSFATLGALARQKEKMEDLMAKPKKKPLKKSSKR